ncbi:MAG: hypothetical protein II881_08820 [Oscillospiraceae bacterium]|nr:hypothetical protein [Oscillospiraceae bacterium]
MFGKQNRVFLELNASELKMVIESLIRLRNRLIIEGRYTDAVDEMLLKLAG